MYRLPRDLSGLFPGTGKLFLIFWIMACPAMTPTVHAGDSNDCKNADLIARWGQGGFRDSRADDGKLGGGQIALDIARCGSPFAVTLSSEFYTEGSVSDAEYSYEISDMYLLNMLYTKPLPGFERTDYLLFAGIGRLKVPYRGSKVDSELFNLGAGLHWKRFEHFGFYALLKYLYAQEDSGGETVIDFNETILLLGVSYRFSL
jgi:hypothetical protein